MYIIVGLGNPGEEYVHTRHNTGASLLEILRKKWELPEWKEDKKNKALISKGEYEGKPLLLLFPQTFMNKSGTSLSSLVTNPKKAEKLCVIHDDLDLPIGSIKMVFNRGSGGHRGIESIMRSLKTEGFVRVRVGISPKTPKGVAKKPHGEKAVNDFILGSFKPGEESELKKVSRQIAEALEIWFLKGISAAIEKAHTSK